MRTAITLLVVLLACGLAAAQEEAAPGAPTDSSVEGAPGHEAVEGAPGAETAPSKNEEDDKGNGGGDTDQSLNPPQPQPVERVIERRTVVVRQLAAAHQRGDQAAVKRLTAELKNLTERITAVEANPLGGSNLSHKQVRRWMADNGYTTSQQVRRIANEEIDRRFGAEDNSVPNTPASAPAAPQGQGGRKMTGAEWLILALIIGATATAIAFALRGTRMDVLAGALGDAANRLQGGERLTFSAGPGRMRLTVEPANATPILPPAPAPAPAPQAQPVQVWFNNNLGPQPQGGGQAGQPPAGP